MPGLRLQGEISLDGSGWQRGLDSASIAANKFSSQTLGAVKNAIAGAFSVGAISQLTRATIDWASKLRDVSDGLGVNVEWLQKMQNGAKLVGADIEDVSKFITEMNKSRQDALLNPAGKNAMAFGRLGISGQDISSLSTQDFFDKLIKAFKGGATTQSVNDIQEVGGKSARNLIAAFSSQFASDSPILAEDIIDQLDDVGDSFTRLKTTLMVGLAPAIVYVNEKLQEFTNWIKRVSTAAGTAAGGELKGEPKKVSEVAVDYLRYGAIGTALKTSLYGWKRLYDTLTSPEVKNAVKQEAESQAKQDESLKKDLQVQREARRRREQMPPLFSQEQINLQEKTVKPYSDALLSVGNFLGAGARSAIDNVAQQQLTTQRMTYEEIKGLRGDLKNQSTIKVP